MNNKERNSNIEFLKVIAIFVILLSHCVPFYGNQSEIWYINGNVSTNDIQLIIVKFFRLFGQIGNVIFITCSSWFLIDNNKINIKKILTIILDSWIISIIFLIICCFLNYDLTIIQIIHQIFPILFKNNWFIGCYLLFYIFHPYLNIIIDNLKQKEFLSLNIFLFILYGIIYFILHNDIYFTELVGFIIIYFFTAYFKKYLKKFNNDFRLNFVIFSIASLLHIFSILLMNYLGLCFSWLDNKVEHWNTLINPIYFLMAITLLNIFSHTYRKNKIINYISSLSLLILLFSENCLFKNNFFPKLFDYIYNTYSYNYISIIIILISIIIFISSIVVSYIYKNTISIIVDKLINFLYIKLNTIYNLLLKKI